MANIASEIADYFRARPGKVIPYEVLYEDVWGVQTLSMYYKNTLRASVSMARKYLPGTIRAVLGLGYIYQEEK